MTITINECNTSVSWRMPVDRAGGTTGRRDKVLVHVLHRRRGKVSGNLLSTCLGFRENDESIDEWELG